jgi:hypothetical protein
MANTIIIKNSSTAAAVPGTGDLTQGEFAVNVTDKKVFTKDSGGSIVELVGAGRDIPETYTKAQRGAVVALTDGATITPDLDDGNNFSVTLEGNRTLANPTNLAAGQSGSIFIVQDGTGSRTLAWGSYWDFATGTAPTLTTTAGAVDRVDYIVRTTGSIHAVFTGDYS